MNTTTESMNKVESSHIPTHSDQEGHPSNLLKARIKNYIALTENYNLRLIWYRIFDDWGRLCTEFVGVAS